MELLPKWNLHGNRPSFYDTDSVTMLELASRLHGAMQELITEYNSFSDEMREKLDKNLLRTLDELVQEMKDNGFFEETISEYTDEATREMVAQLALLTARFENLLGVVKEGSTTGDAELIDGRVGEDGTTYDNIGTAIREQIARIINRVYLYHGIEYDSTTGIIKLNTDASSKVLYNEFKLKYNAPVPVTANITEATYDDTSNRPNIVALNVSEDTCSIKCMAINTYIPDSNDIILFMIYQKRVIPLGLCAECIKVNGMYLSDNPTTKKLYNSSVVSLNEGVVFNKDTKEITLKGGFYIFPMDKIGAVNIEEQTIPYSVSSLVTYLMLDANNVISIVERTHVFQRGEYCLGCIYYDEFIPVELAQASVVYKSNDKTVIDPEEKHITIDDMFRGLGDVTKTTKIVLGGDSITLGTGGDNFATDGDLVITVGSRSYYRNPNGQCWANSFKLLIERYYNAEVINNACSGSYSRFWHENMRELIPTDTDIFILTIGTNDRNDSNLVGHSKEENLAQYYTHLDAIVKYCHANGIQIVLCTPPPVTQANQTSATRHCTIEELIEVIRNVASDNNMDFVNIFNPIIQRLIELNSEGTAKLSGYLPDGLHPSTLFYINFMLYEYYRQFNIPIPSEILPQ